MAVKPRSSLQSAHDYLRVRFHEHGGSAGLVSYAARLAAVESTGTLTLGGTTTSSWATAGWVTPSGDQGVTIDDQRFDSLFRLDNLSGGLLLLAAITSTGNQAATRKLMQFGASSRAVPGGIYWDLTATPNSVLTVTPATNAVTAAAATKNIAGNGLQTLAGYVDMANETVHSALNDDFAGAATASLSDIIAEGDELVVSTAGNFAFSLLSGHNAAASNYVSALNDGGGDVKVRDFWAIRFETDMLANIGALVTEFNAHSHEMLRGIAA